RAAIHGRRDATPAGGARHRGSREDTHGRHWTDERTAVPGVAAPTNDLPLEVPGQEQQMVRRAVAELRRTRDAHVRAGRVQTPLLGVVVDRDGGVGGAQAREVPEGVALRARAVRPDLAAFGADPANGAHQLVHVAADALAEARVHAR